MRVRKSVKGTFSLLGKFFRYLFVYPFKLPLVILGIIKRASQSLLNRENSPKRNSYNSEAATIGLEVKRSLTEENRNHKWNLDLDVLASSRLVGKVVIGSEGKLVFPKLSETPGAYCFTFIKPSTVTTIYIGETEQLRRRFQHYRTPGPTQTTNIRLNALMKDVILNDGEVRVDVITTAISSGHQLDLRDKVARLLVEQAWLLSVRAEGYSVENA